MSDTAKFTAIMIATALCTVGSETALSQSCNGIFNGDVSSRRLYVLADKSPITDGTIRARPLSMSLAYIVPGHPYTSGAVIVKTRHLVEPHTKPTDPRITARRMAYRSPCTEKGNQAEQAAYEQAVEADRYINYHGKGLPDDTVGAWERLDRFHADIGNRPKRWGREYDNRCASTGDWDIAPHFLFERHPSGRQVVEGGSRVRNRIVSVGSALPGAARASVPPDYMNYYDLTTVIFPYRKLAQAMSCVAFTLTIPSTATETQVMILDADDARWPRRDDAMPDPQTTWSIRWQAGTR